MAAEDKTEESPPPSKEESPPLLKSEDQKRKGALRRILTVMQIRDWITLLIIPIILGTTTFLFNSFEQNKSQTQQLEASLQATLDQQRETTLQTYISAIQDLLLNHKLGEPLKNNSSSDNITIQEVRELARARTLVALRGLDPKRKAVLVQFLYGAHLIITPNPIIDLADADLSNVDLTDAILRSIDLHQANLTDAILFGAILDNANLNAANLSGADLRTGLSGVDLGCFESITPTIYLCANLFDAQIEQYRLDQVKTCKNANLPKGLICHRP